MSKQKKPPSLAGIVKPPTTPTIMQSHNDVAAQLRDEDVPDASPAPGRGKGKAKAKPVANENAGMAHRSLYAKPETLDLIREIAFEERISAQSLYREGLLLMLQGRGHYRDKGLDDV